MGQGKIRTVPGKQHEGWVLAPALVSLSRVDSAGIRPGRVRAAARRQLAILGALDYVELHGWPSCKLLKPLELIAE